jgi:hypothetical protein
MTAIRLQKVDGIIRARSLYDSAPGTPHLDACRETGFSDLCLKSLVHQLIAENCVTVISTCETCSALLVPNTFNRLATAC